MAVTVSTAQPILKTLWPQSRVKNLVYPDHALLAWLPKHEDFYGENMYLTVRHADTQGRSAKFSTAQSNAGNFQGVRFLLTRVSDYQVCVLSTEAILAAKKDKGALIKTLDTEIESGLNNISKSLAVSLVKGKSGVLGTLASDPGTGTTFTLSNIHDITNFENGMKIQFHASATAAARAGGTRTVSAVNRDTGVVTVSAAIDAAVGSSDLVIAEGDAYADNSNTYVKCSGLDDWFPSTAPSGGDSHFGVDRSVDPTRLAGVRVDGSALNPEEALLALFSRLGREGGRPDAMFVNHLDLRNVMMALGSKATYKPIELGGVGFTAVSVMGPKGEVALIADQDITSGSGFALSKSSMGLYSLEGCPMIQDLDGNKLSRVYNADQQEVRICYFAQLGCDAPGHNGRLTFPS